MNDKKSVVDRLRELLRIIGNLWAWAWNYRAQIIITFVGGALVIAFVGVMFSECVAGIVGKWFGTIGKKTETLQFLGWIISGFIGVFGLVVFNRRAAAQDENNRLIEKGLAQDRFKAAVDHLSNELTSARIASFHELFYLAKDVPDYTETILDILCAHLRHTKNAKDAKQELMESQTLIDILFSSKAKKIFDEFDYDLQRAQLPKVDFRKIHKPKGKVDFSYANLNEACFDNTDLSGFIFRKTKLRHTKFKETGLQKAILVEADFSSADLSDADLSDANLHRADFSSADFSNANLSNANLSNANLSGTMLFGVDFSNANLFVANLSGANFFKTNFSGADLSHANFSEANLSEMNLSEMNFSTADLSSADLRAADLREAKGLQTAKLSKAKYGKVSHGEDTQFPEEFNPESRDMEYCPTNDGNRFNSIPY